MDKLNKLVAFPEKTVDKEIKYISTGVYILNAALSGSIYGGIIDGKISVFAGEESTGKTFLALNICREAQKEGKHIMYIDTEGNLRLDSLPNYGIDTTKFSLYDKLNKVEDLTIQLNQIIEALKQMPDASGKFLMVIDSIGQMASKKEKDDLIKGENKTDMTKAKALSTMFRTITSDLNQLDIPLIVCNQSYQTLDMFPKMVMKGGNQLYYSASVITFLSKAKLKDDFIDDKIGEELSIGQTGIVVSAKCVKNRFVKPRKIKFEISFEKGTNPFIGLDVFCIGSLFDKIGIAKGKMEVDKSTGEMKFVEGGNRWYVNHLNSHVKSSDLFTPKVFTKKVLDNIEVYVKKAFSYKSHDEVREDIWSQAEKELKNGNTSDMDLDDDAAIDVLFN